MRGYCYKCQEYRSDNGMDAWEITWHNDLAVCERCGSVVDLWLDEKCEKKSITRQKAKEVTTNSAGKNGETRQVS